MATNFPKKGDDKKITLRNSEEKQFPYEFAKNLKEQQPKIWKAGGNIRGNEAFMLWGRARKGEDTESIRAWIKERESWAKRHFRDGQKFKGDAEPNLSNVAGVVAQIKWGVIGNLGVQGMKDVILELTKKLEGRKDNMKNNIDHDLHIEFSQEMMKELHEKGELEMTTDEMGEPIVIKFMYDAKKTDEPMNVSPTVKKGLEGKVEKHNEDVKDLKVDWNPKVTYKKLEKVFDRGIGAYRTNRQSVRPNVKSEEQWAYARVNSFLFVMRKGRFQGGTHDTDLLPEKHPMKKSMKETDNARRNPNCPDGYEHQMPDGSWMCGKRHGGGGYKSEVDEKELLNFLNIMKDELVTEIKIIKKDK
tara:strand:- start:6232 stop:7308 length:1077 start_codon:yes stop_codon:yes gene_type:complete